MIDTLARLRSVLMAAIRMERAADDLKVNQGRILAALNEARQSSELKAYEFKVFSQWGEDGILQRLTSLVPIANKTFIEFGVEDFRESNCRFLMVKDQWEGFVIDGSTSNIARLRSAYYFWMHHLTARCAFITRDNIDGLLRESGFDEDLGILSIDVDGVDYWLLEEISCVRPRILVLEYNAVFGAERAISVPYDEAFLRGAKHFSHLYFGASLPALASLARRKGYTLVGTNSAGCNAFFVRSDLMSAGLVELTPAQAFTPACFREGRDSRGRLDFASGARALAKIKGLPVVNVETGVIETL